MLKRYQIELDRNERDFATFLKSREVTLSKNELKILIASQAVDDRTSLFDMVTLEDSTSKTEVKGKRRRLKRKTVIPTLKQSSFL